MHRSLILAFVFAVAACGDDPTGLGGDLRPSYTLSGIDGTLPAHVWDFVDTPVSAHSGTMEFWVYTDSVGAHFYYAELLRITFADSPDTVTWRNVGSYRIDGGDLSLTPVGGGPAHHAAVTASGITFTRHEREYDWR